MPELSAAVERVLDAARTLAAECGCSAVLPVHLLHALLHDESRAHAALVAAGYTLDDLQADFPLHRTGAPYQPAAAMDTRTIEAVLRLARRWVRDTPGDNEIRTEHLLAALAVTDPQVGALFVRVGLTPESVREAVRDELEPLVIEEGGCRDSGFGIRDSGVLRNAESGTRPSAESDEPRAGDERNAPGVVEESGFGIRDSASRQVSSLSSPQSPHPTTAGTRVSGPESADQPAADHAVLRVLDAAANRSREGLRVVEDATRFLLNDAHLCGLLKSLRHELAAALEQLGCDRFHALRDTAADVGTAISTAAEFARSSPSDVLRANCKRVAESLRTLEEYGKLIDPGAAAAIEQLRYRFYTLEKALLTTMLGRERLAGCRLYLLVTEHLCRGGIERVVKEALEGGVNAVQLREKGIEDPRLLELAEQVRRWTADAKAPLIVNDRPDIAVLSGADGVHVGQDDLSVQQARRIVGPHRLVGVSTHSIEQARQAVLEGADYLGVGPVFASQTKEFSSLAGLGFVTQVAAEIALPWFAIGGITATNIAQVVEAGAVRIAVSSAICGADEPAAAARELKRQLQIADCELQIAD